MLIFIKLGPLIERFGGKTILIGFRIQNFTKMLLKKSSISREKELMNFVENLTLNAYKKKF